METSDEKQRTQQQEPKQNEQTAIILPTKILPLRETNDSETYYVDNPPFPPILPRTPEEQQRYLRILEEAKKHADEKRRFWNMLVDTVKRSGYTPPSNRTTIILNLCCGPCHEGEVLIAFFGGKRYGFPGIEDGGGNVKLIGVDINPHSINRARNNHLVSSREKKFVLPPFYEFIVGDATNLNQFPQIPEKVDVIVIRHHQYITHKDVWTEIFKQALQRVNEEGIVIITSYSDIEHKLLIEILKTLCCKYECEIVINEKNPYTKKLFIDGDYFLDYYITIIKRVSRKKT